METMNRFPSDIPKTCGMPGSLLCNTFTVLQSWRQWLPWRSITFIIWGKHYLCYYGFRRTLLPHCPRLSLQITWCNAFWHLARICRARSGDNLKNTLEKLYYRNCTEFLTSHPPRFNMYLFVIGHFSKSITVLHLIIYNDLKIFNNPPLFKFPQLRLCL